MPADIIPYLRRRPAQRYSCRAQLPLPEAFPPLGASACRHSCGPAITTTDTGGMLGNQFPHVPPEPRPATTLGEPRKRPLISVRRPRLICLPMTGLAWTWPTSCSSS